MRAGEHPSPAYYRLRAYVAGWETGVEGRAPRDYRGPWRDQAPEEFELGHRDGRAAKLAATKAAKERLGVTDDEMRRSVLR